MYDGLRGFLRAVLPLEGTPATPSMGTPGWTGFAMRPRLSEQAVPCQHSLPVLRPAAPLLQQPPSCLAFGAQKCWRAFLASPVFTSMATQPSGMCNFTRGLRLVPAPGMLWRIPHITAQHFDLEMLPWLRGAELRGGVWVLLFLGLALGVRK